MRLLRRNAQPPQQIVIIHMIMLAIAAQECGRAVDDASERALAAEALHPRAKELWPPSARWDVDVVRAGVRAMPRRSAAGATPYAGCVDAKRQYALVLLVKCSSSALKTHYYHEVWELPERVCAQLSRHPVCQNCCDLHTVEFVVHQCPSTPL